MSVEQRKLLPSIGMLIHGFTENVESLKDGLGAFCQHLSLVLELVILALNLSLHRFHIFAKFLC